MQVVNPQFISGKKVLLRYDIDVALGKGTPLRQGYAGQAGDRLQVTEEFKLRAGLPTLRLCLENASQVIMMGHVGRPALPAGGPDGKVVEELRVAPIVEWFSSQGYKEQIDNGQLTILENLRFDPREEACDPEYAKELSQMGDFYVNEAFSAYRPSVSTTILPTLLPHGAGLRFAEEVRRLTEVRDNPKKPFLAVMGGAKTEDKLPVIQVLAEKADAILIGGKLAIEVKEQKISLPGNVMVGRLTEDGLDIAEETTESWKDLISRAKMIVWNGPVGKIDNGQLTIDNLGSAEGSFKIAKMILESEAKIIVGGGDTVAFLGEVGLLREYEKRGFVSVGGGAMLKLLADGTLQTIEALELSLT